MRERGVFLVVIGPDGVGKTTLARNILNQTKLVGRYFHFIPGGTLRADVPQDDLFIQKSREGSSRLLGVPRILRNLVRSWIAYFRTIRPAVRSGSLVVGDRWLYGYIAQPWALRFYGPSWLARVVIRVMPQPDMTVLLKAPIALIHDRKPELSPEEITAEIDLLERAIPQAVVVDASRDPIAIADSVIEQIEAVRGLRIYPPFLGHVVLPETPRSNALAGSTLYTPARTRGLMAQGLGRGLIRTLGGSWLPVAHPSDIPLDARAREALLGLLSQHHIEPESLAFHLRTQADRIGFVVLAIIGGRPVGFVRAGLPGTLDSESQALELLERHTPTAFRVARLIGRSVIGDVELALHSPVLEGFHRPPKDPQLDVIVREIKDALRSLPRPPGTPEHWEPIHGDLTPWNLRQSKAGLTLIDWESVGWGPPSADQVLYMATANALGRRVPSSEWNVEAAKFWLDRMTETDNRRDARLQLRLVGVLRSRSHD